MVRRFALKTFNSLMRMGPALEFGCHAGGMNRLPID